MACGVVDEVLGWLTGVDHEAVSELHGLGTGSTELSGDDNLATLGTGLHDEAVVLLEGELRGSVRSGYPPEHTIACTANGKTVQELVSEGLALGDGRKTTGLDLGGVEGDRVRREAETVSDQAGELRRS